MRFSPPIHPNGIQSRYPSIGWFGLVMTALLVGCSGKSGPESGSEPIGKQRSHPSAILPDDKVYADYAGSVSCKECHEEAWKNWMDSNHQLAERSTSPAKDRVAFAQHETFEHGTQTSTPGVVDGRFGVETRGMGGASRFYPVNRVIGNDPLRQYLVEVSPGRIQTLEASYDPHADEWFNVYGSEDRQPGEWGHWTGRGMNWNSMCASCHNTRLRKHYDSEKDLYRTTMAEMSVGCESCHGPMKKHVEWQGLYKNKEGDPHIAKLDKPAMVETCAMCHSRRSELTGEFEPGDRYADHYQLVVPDESDIYYPDGQVMGENYVYGSFLSSRMHTAGVQCMDCHDPHSQKTLIRGNDLCMRCHNGSYPNSPLIDPAGHGFHKLDQEGGECVGCHMPQTTYMQRHPRRDHGFTIPDPWLTKRYGVPNACNRCHQDKDVDWSIQHVEQWYGDRMNRYTRKRAEWIAMARSGEENAWRPLVEMLKSNEIPYWKAVAANLLEGWVSEREVQSALKDALNHEDPLVRSNAVSSLGSLVAYPEFNMARELQPLLNDPFRSVRVSAAWVLRRQLDVHTSIGEELVQYLDFNSDQPTGLLQKAVFELDRNQPDKAIALMHQATEWDPNSAALRHELAVVYSMQGRTRDALEQMQIACRLAPNEAEFHYKLGLAYNEIGELPKAIVSMEEAGRLDPGHSRALYNLGLAYNQIGRVEEAVNTLAKAETASPRDARIPYARATILFQNGRIQEAMVASERALEIDPGFEAARQMRQMLDSRIR